MFERCCICCCASHFLSIFGWLLCREKEGLGNGGVAFFSNVCTQQTVNMGEHQNMFMLH